MRYYSSLAFRLASTTSHFKWQEWLELKERFDSLFYKNKEQFSFRLNESAAFALEWVGAVLLEAHPYWISSTEALESISWSDRFPLGSSDLDDSIPTKCDRGIKHWRLPTGLGWARLEGGRNNGREAKVLLDLPFRSQPVFPHTSGISSFYDVPTNEWVSLARVPKR